MSKYDKDTSLENSYALLLVCLMFNVQLVLKPRFRPKGRAMGIWVKNSGVTPPPSIGIGLNNNICSKLKLKITVTTTYVHLRVIPERKTWQK